MSRRHHRPRRRERGAAIALVGISMVALMGATALAVDIGLGGSRTRDLQKVADLVAVDVARLLTGESESTLQSAVDTVAVRTAAANDFPVSGSNGTYTNGTSFMRVQLGCWTQATRTFLYPCAEPDAVKVLARDAVDYRFADVIGIAGGEFERDAVATRIPPATTRIGTVAAGLQQKLDSTNQGVGGSATVYAEVLHARLRAAFDTSFSLVTPPAGAGADVVGYEGLADSDVSVGALASAAGFGTPSELADATMTYGQLFEATATALESEGNGVAAATLRSFAARPGFDLNGTIRLASGPLGFEQGTGTEDDPGAAQMRMNVMDLLIGAATVANGRNFVTYDFNPGIPGVTSARVQSSIVEPMQWERGFPGTTVHSAQVRHQVVLTIDGAVLGIPGLTVPITLPLVIEGARGDATYSRGECLEPLTASETQVDVVTSLVRVRLGTATNFQTAGSEALSVQSAVLIQGGGYSIETLLYLGINLGWALGQNIIGNGDVSLGGGTSTHVFHPMATPNPMQRAQGGVAVNVGSQLQSQTTTNLTGLATANLLASLSTVFSNLGDRVIDPILHAAGVTLGGADVASEDLSCGQPQLVE